jgi:hypothetical protein
VHGARRRVRVEESVNREFITDILTMVAIAVSIWLTGERDESVSGDTGDKLPDMRMVGSVGEMPK